MRKDLLPQLALASRALYLREHAKIRGILEEEALLRQRLAKLDHHVEVARTADRAEDPMKAIGADILWRAWEERTRRALNIELSRVMARKLAAMDKVRQAFGRETAVAELAKCESAKRLGKTRKLLEARLLDP